MAIVYLTIEQAIDVHQKTVDVSGGGLLGHLDLEKLASVLEHIQNDDYYPGIEDKRCLKRRGCHALCQNLH